MRASVPTKPKPIARLRVGFVLARHFTLTAFANFIDTLRLAADDGDRSRQVYCQWTVMSSTRSPIVSSSGIAITPESDFIDPAQFHYIVVVGGLLHRGEPIDQATEAYLRRAAEARTVLIGVCTGSFILTRLGVLKGRKVCVSWYHRNDYVDEFGGTPVADRLYVIDGDRITCSGGAGVVDLAAALVEKHVGAQAAQKSLNVLLLDQQRAADSAQPIPNVGPPASDPRVRRAILAMEQAMADPVTIPTLASRLGISERQLGRLFQAELGASPADIYRAMRLDFGHWLLSQTTRSIGDIAVQTGFADGSHFTRAYRRRFGRLPGQNRPGTADLPPERLTDHRLFGRSGMAD